jgi:hypothetical protein
VAVTPTSSVASVPESALSKGRTVAGMDLGPPLALYLFEHFESYLPRFRFCGSVRQRPGGRDPASARASSRWRLQRKVDSFRCCGGMARLRELPLALVESPLSCRGEDGSALCRSQLFVLVHVWRTYSTETPRPAVS